MKLAKIVNDLTGFILVLVCFYCMMFGLIDLIFVFLGKAVTHEQQANATLGLMGLVVYFVKGKEFFEGDSNGV